MGTTEAAEGAVPAPAVRWLFAGYELDESTLELSRSGRLLPIERKPLEVLLFMLQHSGEVVTKEELLAAVWPGRILSDTALAKCISRLREVLGDQNQALIKTAHGYGYRFAGSPRTEVIAREAPPLLAELKVGDHPPLRPLWTLESRIGSGGMGDAWRVRHDKTGELRIFKFARDPGRLTALKREITLYRLIKNTLEDEAPIVTLLDWNLEQPPYFIESRHADGGSLADWWADIGGAAAVPMEERIELIARIADALAAIHSIGVLHKDLKPSNVLLELGANGRPSRVMLGDLGSGGLSDPARMEAMGITRMGFTKTLMNTPGSSGTPMYLAPEVLMGQPPTIQADIYSLGVMLYQLVTGDIAQPLSSGWERAVKDEVLREDIAQAVDGSASRRPASAAEVSLKLRTIELRRAAHQEERAAQIRAADLERAVERMRARRVGLQWAVVALVAGLVLSSVMYWQARQSQMLAQREVVRTQAVSDFLNQDVLSSVDFDRTSVRNITVKQLLDFASAQVEKRFADQPDIAARISESLGRSYHALEYEAEAAVNLRRVLDYHRSVDGAVELATLRLAADLIAYDWVTGKLPDNLARYREALAAATKRWGPRHPAVLNLRWKLALGIVQLGQWQQGAAELGALKQEIAESEGITADFARGVDATLIYVLTDLARYSEAEELCRKALDLALRESGDKSTQVGRMRWRLGLIMLNTQRYAIAAKELEQALSIFLDMHNDDSAYVLSVRLATAQLFLETGQSVQAIAELESLLQIVAQWHPDEIDQSFTEKWPLGEAYQRAGRFVDAEKTLRQALLAAEHSLGDAHPKTFDIRIALAEVLHTLGRFDEAWRMLPTVEERAAVDLPEEHPFIADYHRMRGMLFSAQGNNSLASAELAAAVELTSKCLGSDHWKSRRVRREWEAAITH